MPQYFFPSYWDGVQWFRPGRGNVWVAESRYKDVSDVYQLLKYLLKVDFLGVFEWICPVKILGISISERVKKKDICMTTPFTNIWHEEVTALDGVDEVTSPPNIFDWARFRTYISHAKFNLPVDFNFPMFIFMNNDFDRDHYQHNYLRRNGSHDGSAPEFASSVGRATMNFELTIALDSWKRTIVYGGGGGSPQPLGDGRSDSQNWSTYVIYNGLAHSISLSIGETNSIKPSSSFALYTGLPEIG